MKNLFKLCLTIILLGGVKYIDAASTHASDLITFSREDFTARVIKIMSPHFVANTDIVEKLSSSPLAPIEVVMAVKSSVDDYCKNLSPILSVTTPMCKSLLIQELLKGHSVILVELRVAGYIR